MISLSSRLLSKKIVSIHWNINFKPWKDKISYIKSYYTPVKLCTCHLKLSSKYKAYLWPCNNADITLYCIFLLDFILQLERILDIVKCIRQLFINYQYHSEYEYYIISNGDFGFHSRKSAKGYMPRSSLMTELYANSVVRIS